MPDLGNTPEWFQEGLEGPVGEGTRNDTCTRMSGYLLGQRGWDGLDVLTFLLKWNATACQPSLPAEEVAGVVRSIASLEEAEGRSRLLLEDVRPLDLDEMIARVRGMPEGLPTGFLSLDNQAVRFQPGELSIIAGRLAGGKTSFMINVALRSCLDDKDGAIICVSCESPAHVLTMKMLATKIGIDNGGVGPSVQELCTHLRADPELLGLIRIQEQRLASAIEYLKENQQRIYVIYEPLLRADQLRDLVSHIAQEAGGVKAVFVDYLQLVSPPTGRYDRRDIELGAVGRELKTCAVEMSCPVIAACQLNREGTRNPNDPRLENEQVRKELLKMRPRQHHLREADQIAHFADLVLGVQNLLGDFLAVLPADQRVGITDEHGPLAVAVLKSRFGPMGGAELRFHGRSGAILDPSERDATEQGDETDVSV